jgi:hypothetical protein
VRNSLRPIAVDRRDFRFDKETVMKTLIVAAVAAAAIASSAGVAFAQYGDAVPIRPNYRGEPSCPSNYVIQGGACVSIYSGRRGFREGYNEYRGHGGRGAHRPVMRPDGLLQCQSNYVIRNGMCVSLY